GSTSCSSRTIRSVSSSGETAPTLPAVGALRERQVCMGHRDVADAALIEVQETRRAFGAATVRGYAMAHVGGTEQRQRLLLTVVEAAEMLGVGRTKAYELIADGQLQVVHIGRAARVPLVAVHRYVEALLSPPPRTMRRAPRARDASQPPLPFIDLKKD